MASAIFIPLTPSPTDLAESYFFPVTVTDPTSAPVLNLALIYFNLQASNPSHQPIQMSSNASPAKNRIPLLVRPVESLEPPMSPDTVATTLAAHPDLNATILWAIANGLLSTITQREANEASKIHCLKEQIHDLHDRVEHYENTFNRPPDGYVENDGQVPHFYIPISDGVLRPTKWIKRLEDGWVASYHDTQGPNESPHIIDLYAQADTMGHGKENPIKPIPAWFHTLLLGPSGDFVHLQQEIKDLNNWGLAREITCFHELDQEAAGLAAWVEILYEELNATRDTQTMSEKWLVLSHMAQKAAQLKNLPKKVSMLPTYSRHKNNSWWGRLI